MVCDSIGEGMQAMLVAGCLGIPTFYSPSTYSTAFGGIQEAT